MLHFLAFALQTSQSVSSLVSDFQYALKIDDSLFVLFWLLAYVVMTMLNLKSRYFFVAMKILTTYICSFLVVYIIWAIAQLNVTADFLWYYNILDGETFATPEIDFLKVVDALPYTMWWYVAMEVSKHTN
jgi:hypothetical protein